MTTTREYAEQICSAIFEESIPKEAFIVKIEESLEAIFRKRDEEIFNLFI